MKKLDVAVQSNAAEKKHATWWEEWEEIATWTPTAKHQIFPVISLQLQLINCLQSSKYSVRNTKGVLHQNSSHENYSEKISATNKVEKQQNEYKQFDKY